MRMEKRIITMVVALVSLVAVTNADVLYFDDLTTDILSTTVTPNGYGGLNWSGFGVIHKDYHNHANGYDNGTVSGNYTVYNKFACVAAISDGNFSFNGAYLTAAWNTGLNINLKGYINGSLLYNQTVVVNADAPTWFNFNFNNIDELVFDSFGGVDAGFGSSSEHFAMDNFTYVIPEPATMSFLGLVSGCIYFVRRFFVV